MKKILAILTSLSLIATSSSLVTSCSIGSKHSVLDKDITTWKNSKAFTTSKVFNAIANGNKNIYQADESDATPFKDKNGSYLNIKDLWKRFNGKGELKDDLTASYMRLDYVVPSMIAYYENKANKGDKILTTLNAIENNFNISYARGSKEQKVYIYNPDEKTINGNGDVKINSEGNEDSVINMNKIINNSDFMEPWNNGNNEQKQMFFEKLPHSVNYGQGGGEYFAIYFNVIISIKKDHTQTIKIDGKNKTVDVSKDNYFISNDENKINFAASMTISLPLF